MAFMTSFNVKGRDFTLSVGSELDGRFFQSSDVLLTEEFRSPDGIVENAEILWESSPQQPKPKEDLHERCEKAFNNMNRYYGGLTLSDTSTVLTFIKLLNE